MQKAAVEYLFYGGGSTHNLTIRPTSGTASRKEYKIQDMLGSTRVVIELTGPGSGVITGAYDLDPWGEILWQSGLEKRLGFIDKEKDKESGDYNFGVRQYRDGRFWSSDVVLELKFISV